MVYCEFHADYCNSASDLCIDSSLTTCDGARVLANVYRLWLLLPLFDALGFSDDQIRVYRRLAFPHQYRRSASLSTDAFLRNLISMEALRTAIHRVDHSDLFRKAETRHCLSPRMYCLLGKKLVAIVNTLIPQDSTNAPLSNREQCATLCSCTVASNDHKVAQAPSTLADLLTVHARVCNIKNKMYKGISEALLSRPDFCLCMTESAATP